MLPSPANKIHETKIFGASRVSLRQRTTFVALPPTTLTLRATDFVGRAVGEGGAIIIFDST